MFPLIEEATTNNDNKSTASTALNALKKSPGKSQNLPQFPALQRLELSSLVSTYKKEFTLYVGLLALTCTMIHKKLHNCRLL